MGFFVAFGILFPNMSLMFLFFPVPIKAKYLIPALLCYDAVFGFNPMPGDFTGHFAHLGGAVFGIILTLYWTRNNNNYQVN
ncbi:MAG: rhomboid family intramembrane serine protease [Saprospiraceae bacterium]